MSVKIFAATLLNVEIQNSSCLYYVDEKLP